MNSQPRPKGLLVFFYGGIACTQTLFYFSFRSFRKHQRERELAVSKSPPVYIFYHARSTDFQEKIESLNRLMAVVLRQQLVPEPCRHLGQSPSRHPRLGWRLSLAISLISIFLLWKKSLITG